MPYTGFKKLTEQLSAQKGVKDPAALAASIGRKKFGAKAMAHGAATGHSLKGLQSLIKK